MTTTPITQRKMQNWRSGATGIGSRRSGASMYMRLATSR